MSPFVNMYFRLSQEKQLSRSVLSTRYKLPSHIKRKRSIAWHNYKDLHQRNERSSEIACQALTFYDSINDQYRNYHTHHQNSEVVVLN